MAVSIVILVLWVGNSVWSTGTKLLPIAYTKLLLGAFTKLRKTTIRFVMSVRPSALNNSAPAGPFVSNFDIYVFFENMLRKLKLH
jgi:hypothetical protein